MFCLFVRYWPRLMKTTLGGEDETYVHYSSEIPGFSYFVIGEKELAEWGEVIVIETADSETRAVINEIGTTCEVGILTSR